MSYLLLRALYYWRVKVVPHIKKYWYFIAVVPVSLLLGWRLTTCKSATPSTRLTDAEKSAGERRASGVAEAHTELLEQVRLADAAHQEAAKRLVKKQLETKPPEGRALTDFLLNVGKAARK